MRLTSPKINEAILPLRQALLEHRLYGELTTLEQIQMFMEHHVFAVWDFMSLLKALQCGLTCVETPWLPVGEPRLRRLINEIVLGEESDITEQGEAISHFDLYRRAMREAGASTSRIDRLIVTLRAGASVDEAIDEAQLPTSVSEFMRHSFAVIKRGKLHEIAAAFTYGREDLIPGMFGGLVASLDDSFPGKLTTFRYYLERHIELDGDEHGVLGREMVDLLCGDDSVRQAEAQAAAVKALQVRIKLWDGILESLVALPCP